MNATELAAATARAWIDAFNRRDLERLTALADERLVLVRPHGATLGRDQLGELLDRHRYGVGLQLVPRGCFARGGTVVVDARAEWRWVETGELADREQRATVLHTRAGRITRVTVHERLAEALAAAGFDPADELSTGPSV